MKNEASLLSASYPAECENPRNQINSGSHTFVEKSIAAAAAVPTPTHIYSSSANGVYITITALISWSFILARPRCRSSAERVEKKRECIQKL